jgi:hypothetical protein
MPKEKSYFRFYPLDFMTDPFVMEMTHGEIGLYFTFLCICWQENGLDPNLNIVKLALNNNIDPTKPAFNHRSTTVQPPLGIGSRVMARFYKKDGKYYNKRLEKERQRLDKWRKKSKLGGLISRGKLKGGSRVVQPKIGNGLSMAEGCLKGGSIVNSYIKKNIKKKVIANDNVSSFASAHLKDSPQPTNPFKHSKLKISFNYEKQEWENISDGDMKIWRRAYPALNLESELAAAADWCVSNPDKKKIRWRAFLSRWLKRAQDKGGSKRYQGQTRSPVPPGGFE